MCGIFSLFNFHNFSDIVVNEHFMKGVNRGPEFSKLDTSFNKLHLGFHRLAINGLNDESNQPLIINNIALICNGEIYNYKRLYSYMGIQPTTGSDCEVIIHLYIRYGIVQTLKMLDGVYAFVLYDYRLSSDSINKCYVARDPLGVRPLYSLTSRINNISSSKYGFASELKCLEHFYNTDIVNLQINQFKPGSFSELHINVNEPESNWKLIKENILLQYKFSTVLDVDNFEKNIKEV